MSKPADYFMSLLQARGNTTNNPQGLRKIDDLVLEHLSAVKETVDYSYVEPEPTPELPVLAEDGSE